MNRKVLAIVLAMCILTLTACSSSVGGSAAPSEAAPSSTSPASGDAAPSADAPAQAAENGSFPVRQIEMIVPYDAGGGVDVNGRAIGEAMEAVLGVPVVIVNKPGAGGVPGLTYGSMAEPDGYTITIGNIISICSNNALGELTIDPVEGMEYLGCTVMDPGVIAVAKDSPYNSIADIVAYLNDNPDGLTYGATGVVSLDGLLCVNLEKLAGVSINNVTFNSGKDSLAALMGNHIQLMGGTLSEVLTTAQDGEVKIIAVGASERLPEIPDVPTFAEEGYDMAVTASKRALLMPKGADPEVVKVLVDAIEQGVKSEGFIAKCKELGLRDTYLTPEECAAEATALMTFFSENFADE